MNNDIIYKSENTADAKDIEPMEYDFTVDEYDDEEIEEVRENIRKASVQRDTSNKKTQENESNSIKDIFIKIITHGAALAAIISLFFGSNLFGRMRNADYNPFKEIVNKVTEIFTKDTQTAQTATPPTHTAARTPSPTSTIKPLPSSTPTPTLTPTPTITPSTAPTHTPSSTMVMGYSLTIESVKVVDTFRTETQEGGKATVVDVNYGKSLSGNFVFSRNLYTNEFDNMKFACNIYDSDENFIGNYANYTNFWAASYGAFAFEFPTDFEHGNYVLELIASYDGTQTSDKIPLLN